MSDPVKELVEVIAKALVKNPDKVQVQVNVNENAGETGDNVNIIYELHVAPEDMGKIIGKQGRIAKAIRTVVKSAAIRENKRVIIEIV